MHSRKAIADRDDPLRRDGCAGSVTANSLRCATLVAMVQTADLWEGDNGACRRRLYGPRLRGEIRQSALKADHSRR